MLPNAAISGTPAAMHAYDGLECFWTHLTASSRKMYLPQERYCLQWNTNHSRQHHGQAPNERPAVIRMT